MTTINETPKYLRVTVRGEGGTSSRFVGMVRRHGNVVTGERNEDDGSGGIRQLVLIADMADVLKVERQDRYESWKVVR